MLTEEQQVFIKGIRQRIKITSAEQAWIAVMEDNPAIKDFFSFASLTLTLKITAERENQRPAKKVNTGYRSNRL